MRIAALQYANGQVKQCDGSIEASHCFCRKFRAIIMCAKFTATPKIILQQYLEWFSISTILYYLSTMPTFSDRM